MLAHCESFYCDSHVLAARRREGGMHRSQPTSPQLIALIFSFFISRDIIVFLICFVLIIPRSSSLSSALSLYYSSFHHDLPPWLSLLSSPLLHRLLLPETLLLICFPFKYSYRPGKVRSVHLPCLKRNTCILLLDGSCLLTLRFGPGPPCFACTLL